MKKLNIPQYRLNDYKKFLEDDYKRWTGGDTKYGGFEVHFEVGNKYIKVFADDGKGNNVYAHSFIVNKATGKFPVGTILKAASWKAPATNFARGDIYTFGPAVMQFPNCSIRWSGIT